MVPDAGPLISLAKAGLLDLLLLPGYPIYVVDQVRYEVTGSKQYPDAIRIEEFIWQHPGAVHEFLTAVGQAAASKRAQGEIRQPGQGEAAIAEFLQRLDEITGDPEAPVLLLFEDGDIGKSRFLLPNSIHPLSTRAFLRGLERRRLIQSADDAWKRIEAAGRSPSSVSVDQPGSGAGRLTRW